MSVQLVPISFPLSFEELGAYRRVCLGLIPNVYDPEKKKSIQFSKHKSSRLVKIDESGMSVTQEGGYRLCRASRHIPRAGAFFWEFIISSFPTEESHCRIGIATKNAQMEAPVGFDEFGYSIADKGFAYHNGKKIKEFSFNGFKQGDTVSFGAVVNG